jgi:hypothetical protein
MKHLFPFGAAVALCQPIPSKVGRSYLPSSCFDAPRWLLLLLMLVPLLVSLRVEATNCPGFRTQTQGGWGATPKGGNSGAYLHNNFQQVFPDGVTVGCDNTHTLRLTSAQQVTDFLPSGSTARALDRDYTNPGTNYSNVFAGQVVALTLSVKFDEANSSFGSSPILLKDLVIGEGPFAGKTVGFVLAQANLALGGCSALYTLAQLHEVVSRINESYVDGVLADGALLMLCPPVCEFTGITCPSNTNLGTFTCSTIGSLPALPTTTEAAMGAPYHITIGTGACGPVKVKGHDNGTPTSCGTGHQVITRTVTVWDDKNNNGILDSGENPSTCTFTYTIERDTQAPTWSTEAGALDVTLECDNAAGLTAAQALTPVATDNCDQSLIPTKTSGPFVPGDCGGTYTNTWTVKDDCENVSAVYTQVITIQDTKAPTWSTAASSLNRTVECDDATGLAAAQALAPTAQDNCDNSLTPIKTAGHFIAAACGGTYTNTWVVKDDCGNTSAHYTQVITITDTKAPSMTCPANITVASTQGTAPAVTGSPTGIADNCDTALGSPTYTDSPSVCEPNGNTSITRTWTIKDACGNTKSCTQKITITTTYTADCFGITMLERQFTGTNTIFRFRACANNCPNALSHISFIIPGNINIVSPLNNATYTSGVQYKVVIPVDGNRNGVKYESVGEGIKNNACSEFVFVLAGDQTGIAVTVETKAGQNIGSVTVHGCQQNATRTTAATNVPAASGRTPKAEKTLSVYPNPSAQKATIEFALPDTQRYTLHVYNAQGWVVSRIAAGTAEAGKRYSFPINSELPDGIYLVRLTTDKGTQTLRLVRSK